MSNSPTSTFARKIIRVFLSPAGRIGRLSFFLYSVFVLLFWTVLLLLFVEVLPDSAFPIVFLCLICIFMMYVAIVLTVKRLHDLNYSGWSILLSFIPILNLFIFICVFFVPGTEGKNKFGEPEEPFFHSFNKKSVLARNLDKPFSRVILTILVIALLWGFGYYSSLDDTIINKSNELIESIEGGEDVTGGKFEKLAEDSYAGENKVELYKNAGYRYMYSLDGDDYKAKESFKKALALVDEGTFDYYLISAEIAMTENKARTALFNYEKAYEISPSDFQVNNGLGIFYFGMTSVLEQFTDYQKALKYFKVAYEQNPSNTIKENMAIAYFYLEDYDEALKFFLEIKETSKSFYLDYWVGACYLAKENLDLGQQYLKSAYDNGVEMEQVFIDFINTDL